MYDIILFLKETIWEPTENYMGTRKITIQNLPFFFCPNGIWDLSSLIRDRTHTPLYWKYSLNHWITREVPRIHHF